jgi:hypothetical protein
MIALAGLAAAGGGIGFKRGGEIPSLLSANSNAGVTPCGWVTPTNDRGQGGLLADMKTPAGWTRTSGWTDVTAPG